MANKLVLAKDTQPVRIEICKTISHNNVRRLGIQFFKHTAASLANLENQQPVLMAYDVRAFHVVPLFCLITLMQYA